MKAASVKDIKNELENLPPNKLFAYCMRLAKFKKENKELLTYLLFEEHDENAYVEGIKAEINLLFEELNTKNLYFAKKNIRKIIRTVNKFIKYSEIHTTEVELTIYIISKIDASGLDMSKSVALTNIYKGLLKKVNKTISSLHEDLQYDFKRQLNQTNSPF